MAYKVQKPCKVCGKLYTPCYDCEKDNSIFHWRTVACSVECGKKYFDMVMKARDTKTDEKNVAETALNEIVENTDIVEKKTSKKKTTKIVNKEESEQIE